MGYLVISFIDAAILVGVAMHSYAWSIRINLQPLRYQLKWIPFLIFSIIGDVLIIILFGFSASSESTIAFIIIRYLGVVISVPCVFLCFNELFYLIKQLQKPLFKMIRRCDFISFVLTLAIVSLEFFFENWIFYNFLACCICVASIKIFHFSSLKQAFTSMLIMFAASTVLGIVLHFILPQSYNDYAG